MIQGTGSSRYFPILLLLPLLTACGGDGSSTGNPFTPQLNDTGMTWGGNYPNGNNATCIGETIAAQDCSTGRDSDPATNSDADGHAGFSFTKLGADGTELAIQDGVYSSTGNEAAGTSWSCVQDNITGLVWEVKTDASTPDLHDKDWEYTPYDSAYNDGDGQNPGDNGTDNVWSGPVDSGNGSYSDNCFNAGDVCTTEQFAADVNSEALCGFTDWRVPEVEELRSIVNYGSSGWFIDEARFPNTVEYFNTATPYANSPDQILLMGFNEGTSFWGFRQYEYGVRLVRSDQ